MKPISERITQPTPTEVRTARERAGLTQAQAAELVSTAKTKPYRTWSGYETTDTENVNARAIPLATWELFLLLTHQHPSMKLSIRRNEKEIPMMPIAPTLNGLDMIRLRDVVLTAPCFGGTPGDYPWDRWGKAAIQAGVSPDLANLGRAVFREAFQHDWPDEIKVECGWLDGGQTMILQALAFPGKTEARWRYLYSSDNFGDDPFADAVSTDPFELAVALKQKGIPTSVIP